MLNFSQFHYWLYPCCADSAGQSSMKVNFYFNPQPDTGCPNCFIPLSQTRDTIDIRCPGCQTPGIETVSLRLVRVPASYGIFDQDNDGLADSSLTQITPADSAHVATIRQNASFSGDHLQSEMLGIFRNGSQTPAHNLTYPAYLNFHSPFKYLYIEQNISRSNSADFNLVPDSAILTVFSSSNFTHYVNLSTEMTRSGDMYFFRIEPDSIDTAYTIAYNDSFLLRIHFRVCGNVPGASGAAADNYFDADPIAGMYFSDSLFTNAVYFTHAGVSTADEGYAFLCQAGDSIDTCSYSAAFLDPNWLYFCGAYSAIHRFYSIDVTNVSTWSNILSQDSYSPCHKRLNMIIRCNIGGDAENVFPFEYRAPMTQFTVNQFLATIPPEFLSNSATLNTIFHTYKPGCAGRNNVSVREITTYPPITGSQAFSYPFLEQANESFSLPVGLPCDTLITIPFGNTQYVGDEFAELQYIVNLYPVCDSQQCVIPVDTIFANLPIFGCAIPDTGYFPSVKSDGYGNLTMPYFNTSDTACLDTPLIVLSQPGIIPVSTTQIQFQFSITNTTIDTGAAAFVAPNVWVFITDTSFLQNMTITCTSSNCTGLNNAPPDSNNFFRLGNISPGTAQGIHSCAYTITADYIECLGAGVHTLPIYYGWYCDTFPPTLPSQQYPSSLADDICSGYFPLTLTFDEDDLNFVPHTTSFSQPDSFALCNSYIFEACVQSQDGGVDSLVAFIQLSDSLLLNDSTIYLFINGDSILVSADTVSQNLYSVNLSAYDSLLDYNDSLGQAPDELAYGGFICLHYTVTPVCGYNFISMPEVNFNATTFCGDPIDTLVEVPNWNQNPSVCNPPCNAQFSITTGADTLICDSNCVTLTTFLTGNHGNLQYSWFPTGDTTANPTVCPDTTTTYIVTAIDSSAGTSAIDSVTVDVITTTLGCCIPDNFQAGVDFNFTGIHSSSLSYNSITTASIILINDTFFVDTNFTFQGCSNVVLGPNAVIWVTPLDTLNIYDSHLYACSDLWNEINVRATATIDVDGSRVENSKQAIFCDGGATIRVVSSVFDQNFYDIYLINPSFPGWNVLIERDTFKCTQTLRNPLPNNRTYAHVSIISVPDVISIGNSNYGNYFENADFGIYAEKAQPYIFKNVFFNFQPFNGTTHSYGVVGLNNRNMYVGDYGIANTFEECETGVHIGNSSSFVLDNTFIKNYNSIISVFNSGRTNYIYNNHISSTKNGIISLWNPYSTTEILGNDIATLPPDSGATNYGIYVGDWSFLGPSGINRVLKNTISSQSTYGIYSNSIKGVEIADNTITLDHLSTPSSTYFGIRSDNCGKGFYNHNCVYRPGSKQNLRGITFADSPNSSIYCNTTDGTDFGIQLYSNCDQSLTKGNTMVNHGQALVLGSPIPAVGGVMGNQLQFIEIPDTFVVGNYYDNDVVGTMTYNLGATPPPFYEVHGTPYFDYPSPNLSFAGSPINFSFSNAIPYNLCPDCSNPADGHPDDKKMSLAAAEETAQDTLSDPDEGDIIWKKKKGLYEELKQDSSLIDSSTILETYADTTSSDAIGKLTDVKEAIFAVQDTSIDSTTKVSRIATAVSKNNQVSAQVSPEANEKALNTVYIETYAQGIYELNSSQLSIVENIASQCPYTGGNAVFMAWNILRTIDPSRTFDDSVLCNGYSLRKAHNQQIKNEIRPASIFRVYPNPTTGLVTIESYFHLNADVTINLVNMIGKVTKSEKVKMKGNSFTIDISGLNSGVYQYQISINDVSNQSGKLVLIK